MLMSSSPGRKQQQQQQATSRKKRSAAPTTPATNASRGGQQQKRQRHAQEASQHNDPAADTTNTTSSQQEAPSPAKVDKQTAVEAFKRAFSSGLSSTPAKQQFDYLLVYDFEATTIKTRDLNPIEFIELACCIVDTATASITASYQSFIRPTHHPQLDPFAIELCGIQQHQVDSAPLLADVLGHHHEWLEQQGVLADNVTSVACTWTEWDLKVRGVGTWRGVVATNSLLGSCCCSPTSSPRVLRAAVAISAPPRAWSAHTPPAMLCLLQPPSLHSNTRCAACHVPGVQLAQHPAPPLPVSLGRPQAPLQGQVQDNKQGQSQGVCGESRCGVRQAARGGAVPCCVLCWDCY